MLSIVLFNSLSDILPKNNRTSHMNIETPKIQEENTIHGIKSAHPLGVGKAMGSILGPNSVIVMTSKVAPMSDARH